MSKHGPQFDEFTAQSGEHHGGALFDEHHGGPSANAGTDAVTLTYREPTANGSGHGAHWDEFGWTQMAEHHGRFFDSDFKQPVVGGEKHGTYFDVFRGGNAEVRVDVDGMAGLEARVIECHADHAVVELRGRGKNDGGGRREVNLGQIREWRRATAQGQASETRKPSASPGNTTGRAQANPGEAPSTASHTARGGGRTELDTSQEPIFTTVKSLREAAGLDVTKMGEVTCSGPSCSHAFTPHTHGTVTVGGGKRAGAKPAQHFCSPACHDARVSKTAVDDVDVAKTLGDLRKAAGLEA